MGQDQRGGRIWAAGGMGSVQWEEGRGRGRARSPPEDRALAWLPDNVIVFVQWQQLGKAKVSDLDMGLALHQDVTCCQVAVHTAAGAQVLHALRADMGYRLQGDSGRGPESDL